ncbi:hypothetical protein ACFLTP_02090 [Chloroflexota bacterium]
MAAGHRVEESVVGVVVGCVFVGLQAVTSIKPNTNMTSNNNLPTDVLRDVRIIVSLLVTY